MSRQRGDPHELGFGPLFSPPVSHLVARKDPETSVEAAAKVVEAGHLMADQEFALRLVREHPGSTCKDLGRMLAVEIGFRGNGSDAGAADPERCRQRIGRRLNELTNPRDRLGYVPGKPHLIETRGRRDGCAVWWPVDAGR